MYFFENIVNLQVNLRSRGVFHKDIFLFCAQCIKQWANGVAMHGSM